MTATLLTLTNTVVVDRTLALAASATKLPSPPTTTVVVFNCTPVTATIDLGSTGVSLPGFAAGTLMPSFALPQMTSLDFSITVHFGQAGWQSDVSVGTLSVPMVCLWCFSNGFVLTLADGALVQISFFISS